MPKETGKSERRHTKETPESLADTQEMLTPKEQAKQDIRAMADQIVESEKMRDQLHEQLNALEKSSGEVQALDVRNLKEQMKQVEERRKNLEPKLDEISETLDGMKDDLATTMKEKQDILGAEDLSDVMGQVLEMEEQGGKMVGDVAKLRVYSEAIDHARKQEE